MSEKRTIRTALTAYLDTIGKTEPLTREEERALFQKLERGRSRLEEAKERKAGRAEIQRLERAVKETRDTIVERNLRLAASVSKKYQYSGIDTLDLIQEGAFGIFRAIETFDWRRGVPFSSYACIWIQQRMGLAVANQSRTVRLPTYLLEWQQRIRRLQQEGLESVEELSAASGLTAEQTQRALDADTETVRLDAPVGDCQRPLHEALPDKCRMLPDAEAEEKIQREEIEAQLSKLDPRTAQVVRLRYGLDDAGSRSLREVGLEVGLSRERVRQLEADAFAQLRRPESAGRLRQLI